MLSGKSPQSATERRATITRAVQQTLLLTIGYYLGAKIGLALTLPPASTSAIWLPNAILLAALMLAPPRRWWLYLLGGLLGHCAAQLPVESPGWVAVRYFNNLPQVLLAAVLVRRFAGAPDCFERLRQVVFYILLAVVLAPALVAFQAAAIFTWSGRIDSFWFFWRARFLSNALATLTVTPVIILAWQHLLHWVRHMGWRRYAEAFLLTSGLVLVGQMIYSRREASEGHLVALLYAPLPFLLWAAVRFAPVVTYAMILLNALLSIRLAISGHGPFVTQSPSENVFSLEAFLLIIALPLILLATLIKERRDAATALRESSRQFRELADTVPAMIWVSDEKGKCVFINQRWLAFTGRSFNDALGAGWLRDVHPEDRARSSAAYYAAAVARTTYQCEFRLRRADGEYRWVLNQGEPRLSPERGLFGYVGSCIDIAERKRAEEALRHSHERAQSLAGQLITAQEDERKRIALELHDDLNQKVAAFSLGLSHARRALPATAAEALAELTELREQAQELTEHIRRLSHQLHPAVLEHFGLSAALDSYCAEFSRHEGIAVEIAIADPLNPLPAAVELCLFRITQEALRNIARHSGARRAQVKLLRCAAQVQLFIADDGAGFDPEPARRRGGLGLLSMEERVRFLQGSFELCTQPGQGTKLTVRIPLPNEH